MISHEARRVGSDDNPAHEISYNGRQPEPVRQVSEHQGGSKTTGEGQDEIKVMHSLSEEMRQPWGRWTCR